jgi:hypothetical protein
MISGVCLSAFVAKLQSKAHLPAHQKQLISNFFYPFSCKYLAKTAPPKTPYFSPQPRMFAQLWMGRILRSMATCVGFRNAVKKMKNQKHGLLSTLTLSLCAFAPLPSVNLGSIYLSNPFNQRNQRLKTQSIKNNNLCETKPIYEEPKMIITLVARMNYNEQ